MVDSGTVPKKDTQSTLGLKLVEEFADAKLSEGRLRQLRVDGGVRHPAGVEIQHDVR